MPMEYEVEGFVDTRLIDLLAINGTSRMGHVRFPEMVVYTVRPDVPNANRLYKSVTIVLRDNDAAD